ncbi:MAG: hypothetical protein IIV82_09550, partial [Ruminococcus sp.]|nr:hypothetical protein [Ruminococcus sp.]
MSSPISEALFYVSDAGALFRPAVDDAIQTKNVAKGGSGAASRCRHAADIECLFIASILFSPAVDDAFQTKKRCQRRIGCSVTLPSRCRHAAVTLLLCF